MKHLRKKGCFVFVVAALAAAFWQGTPLFSQGTGTQIDLTISLESTRVPEYFPIPFTIGVTNHGTSQIAVCPYEVGKPSYSVPYVKIENPLALPPKQFIGGSFEIVRETLRPGSTLLLRGYIQDYVRHLGPGTYNFAYTLQWSCPDDSKGEFSIKSNGRFAFTVTSADSATLQQYISQQVTELKDTVEFAKALNIARGIALIDSPEVVPALGTLIHQGFIAEAVDATTRLPDAEAVNVLAVVAGSSNDSRVVRDAIKRLEERRGSLPSSVINVLLTSGSKWLQVPGIEYVGRNKRVEFSDQIKSLLDSAEVDVRHAAQAALDELQTPK
jgi:hypothetical protein